MIGGDYHGPVAGGGMGVFHARHDAMGMGGMGMGLHGGIFDPFANLHERGRRRVLAEDEEEENGGMEDDEEDLGAGPSRRGRGDTRGLSTMFEPPREIIARGSFEQVKAQAQTKGAWLLVHVHDPSDFDSHRMNRDVWSHETLKEIIKGSFVFWQTLAHTEPAQRFINSYRLDPSTKTHIAILDPLTGQKMRSWTGFVDAERFMEDIMDFTAHGPLDEGAHGLAGQAVQREASARATVAARAAAPPEEVVAGVREYLVHIYMSTGVGFASLIFFRARLLCLGLFHLFSPSDTLSHPSRTRTRSSRWPSPPPSQMEAAPMRADSPRSGTRTTR